MRHNNGYGSCHKIGGKVKRRNPWRVRVTDRWEYDEKKGKAVQKYRTIGYYPDRKSALMALAEYNKNPVASGTADITFADLYKMWWDKKADKWSPDNKRGYEGAYKHSAPLYNMRVKDIRAEHLENVMANVTVGVSGQKRIKTFWNQLFKYALERDIIHKSYADFITTKDKDSKVSTRKPFSKEQIQLLWDNIDIEGVDTILISIYTGMRPSELLQIHKDNVYLEDRYMIGGIKTEAGIDRVIPIHKSVLPLIEKRLQSTDYLVSMPNGRQMQYRYYLEFVWKPIRDKLGFTHTPHETRHTFISLATISGIDERLIKQIVGHSIGGSVTDRYRHAYIESLVNAIDMFEI